MSEPVTLYPKKGGDPVISVAPSETQRMLESGEWQLEPAPEPKPKPKTTRRKRAADGE
jgi:hypothetical protein